MALAIARRWRSASRAGGSGAQRSTLAGTLRGRRHDSVLSTAGSADRQGLGESERYRVERKRENTRKTRDPFCHQLHLHGDESRRLDTCLTHSPRASRPFSIISSRIQSLNRRVIELSHGFRGKTGRRKSERRSERDANEIASRSKVGRIVE